MLTSLPRVTTEDCFQIIFSNIRTFQNEAEHKAPLLVRYIHRCTEYTVKTYNTLKLKHGLQCA